MHKNLFTYNYDTDEDTTGGEPNGWGVLVAIPTVLSPSRNLKVVSTSIYQCCQNRIFLGLFNNAFNNTTFETGKHMIIGIDKVAGFCFTTYPRITPY